LLIFFFFFFSFFSLYSLKVARVNGNGGNNKGEEKAVIEKGFFKLKKFDKICKFKKNYSNSYEKYIFT